MKRLPSISKILILFVLVSLVLVACQAEPEEVIVEVTRVVEGETVTETITQEVEVTRVVEGEVVTETITEEVEVTRVVEVAAEAVPAAKFPSQYATIADYEAATGNSITSFAGAPMLEADYPPAAERVPSEPVVVQTLAGIGEYGGELAGPSTNPTCCGWDAIEMRLQKLVTIDTDLVTIIPNVAKAFEISDDQTTYTFHLREGHKWSDGEPFTAEDFRFYYEDVLANEELNPAPPWPWAQNGVLADFEVIDDMTVQYTFPEPNPSFIVAIADEVGNRGYRPAHYFKQFHIDYNPDANELAAESGAGELGRTL